MDEPWTTLESTILHRNPWRSVRVDRVRLHAGDEIEYTYLETPAAVFVVPLTDSGKIVLIRQYRHPVRDWAWEVPAGSPGEESLEVAAHRELAEEIGGTCGELVSLGWFYSSSAQMNLKSHAFLALDVRLDRAPEHEPTELLEAVLLDPGEAFARARDGRINDGQSALALLMAEPLVRHRLRAR
jgi:ADP-ribose pyrophosphatase